MCLYVCIMSFLCVSIPNWVMLMNFELCSMETARWDPELRSGVGSNSPVNSLNLNSVANVSRVEPITPELR